MRDHRRRQCRNTLAMKHGPSERTGGRHFRCTFCSSIVPPSQRGLGPLERLLCAVCRSGKKSTEQITSTLDTPSTARSSSDRGSGSGSDSESSPSIQIKLSTSDKGSIIQMLLDGATPTTKRMWGEIEVFTTSKRKAVNPRRYISPVDT